MADEQSLLQPGETLGPPVSSPNTQGDSSLLQPGETLGPPAITQYKQGNTIVPNANATDTSIDNPIDIIKGLGEEAWSTAKSARRFFIAYLLRPKITYC